MEPLNVRPYNDADSSILHEIDRLTWSPNNSPGPGHSDDFDEYRRELQQRTIRVAEQDSKVCGYVGVGSHTPLPTNAHVAMLDIAVHPQFQRRGVATALLKAAEDLCRTNGKLKVALRVLATNPGAEALYRSIRLLRDMLIPVTRVGGKNSFQGVTPCEQECSGHTFHHGIRTRDN